LFVIFNSKFLFIFSKSINEESADYETIKALRESVDSLNYKFDDSNGNTQSSSSFFPLNLSNNQFRINLNEINKDFSYYDDEFNANNWADLQTEEVYYLKYYSFDQHYILTLNF
jgi:hypothetical protein